MQSKLRSTSFVSEIQRKSPKYKFSFVSAKSPEVSTLRRAQIPSATTAKSFALYGARNGLCASRIRARRATLFHVLATPEPYSRVLSQLVEIISSLIASRPADREFSPLRTRRFFLSTSLFHTVLRTRNPLSCYLYGLPLSKIVNKFFEVLDTIMLYKTI